ncbi:hypothetical protein CFREI_08970 [Corynebacterium freiburgense]|nr:hypothetical protein CFREI_08970 [Corynebacterium freiburgense]
MLWALGFASGLGKHAVLLCAMSDLPYRLGIAPYIWVGFETTPRRFGLVGWKSRVLRGFELVSWVSWLGSGREVLGLVGCWSVLFGAGRSFRALVGLLEVRLGAGWACCHRFHFFGGFYGICDTIGREPVTDSIFFAVFMESATNPRSTLVCNVGCCHKFHFFRRFYGICDSRNENITSLIGCAY